MSALVVDASVAVKWFLPEPDSGEALRLAAAPFVPIAPSLLWSELANAVWKRIRRGEVELSVWPAMADTLSLAVEFRIVRPELLGKAIGIAVEFSHPVYDCQYLALAIEEDAPIVTADRRFISAFARTRHAERFISVSEAAARQPD